MNPLEDLEWEAMEERNKMLCMKAGYGWRTKDSAWVLGLPDSRMQLLLGRQLPPMKKHRS